MESDNIDEVISELAAINSLFLSFNPDCIQKNFGFGISLILSHIENDLKEISNRLVEEMKEIRGAV